MNRKQRIEYYERIVSDDLVELGKKKKVLANCIDGLTASHNTIIF